MELVSKICFCPSSHSIIFISPVPCVSFLLSLLFSRYLAKIAKPSLTLPFCLFFFLLKFLKSKTQPNVECDIIMPNLKLWSGQKMHLVRCEEHSEYVKHGNGCVTNNVLRFTSVDGNTSPDANILKRITLWATVAFSFSLLSSRIFN